MDKETLLGLAKLLEKEAKLARPSVVAGKHAIDEIVHVRISGTLSVGADTEAPPTHKIPWTTVFALFLRHAGVTRETAMSKLVLAMTEALETGADAAEGVAALAPLEAAEALVQAGLDQLPKETRRGAVSVRGLHCSEVTPAEDERAA